MLFTLGIKKILISMGIVAASCSPFVFMNVHKDNFLNFFHSELSDIKKEFLLTSKNEVLSGLNYQKLFEELLLTKQGQDHLLSSFNSYLGLVWFKSQRDQTHSQTFIDAVAAEETEYSNLLSQFQDKPYDIYDANGGWRDFMKHKYLSSKLKNSWKNFLTEFKNENFTINLDSNKHFIDKNNLITKTELEKKENWSKIGFFGIKDDSYEAMSNNWKQVLSGKFDFLNWAYDYWYKKTQSYHVSMALWKDINNSEKFKEFKTFIAKRDYDNDDKSFLPKHYTDDNSTSIYVSAIDSYSNLYPEFVSAANFQYKNLLFGESTPENKSILKTNISNFNDLKTTLKDSTNASIIKNYPKWIVIKDRAGVHAISIDGYEYINTGTSQSDKIQKAKEQFNYRNLQTTLKDKLKLEKTLDIQTLDIFKTYLSNNFDFLIAEYISSNDDYFNKLFCNISAAESQYIKKYKNFFTSLNSLINLQEKFNKNDALKKIKHDYQVAWIDDTNIIKTLSKDNNVEVTTEEENWETIYKTNKLSLQVKLNQFIKNINLDFASKNEHFFVSERLFFNDFIMNNVWNIILSDKEIFKYALNKTLMQSDNNFISDPLLKNKIVEKSNLFFIASDNNNQQQQLNNDNIFKKLKFEFLKNNSKHILSGNYHLGQQYLNELITLSYLLKDDFKEFRNWLETKVSNKSNDTYIHVDVQNKKTKLFFLDEKNYLTDSKNMSTNFKNLFNFGSFDDLKKLINESNNKTLNNWIDFLNKKFLDKKFKNTPVVNVTDNTTIPTTNNPTETQITLDQKRNKFLNWIIKLCDDSNSANISDINKNSLTQSEFDNIYTLKDGCKPTKDTLFTKRNTYESNDKNNFYIQINQKDLENFNSFKSLIEDTSTISSSPKTKLNYSNISELLEVATKDDDLIKAAMKKFTEANPKLIPYDKKVQEIILENV